MAQSVGKDAVVPREKLIDGVTNAGWIAVMHADGNGIGEIFRNLGKAYAGDELLDRLNRFSAALEEITINAMRSAVSAISNKTGWILPLVLGGDDVTVVMDGRVAFDVTAAFLREFARLSAQNSLICEVVAAVNKRPDVHEGAVRLAACAGIAYVKPHFAFSEAYSLAEALCASAKQVKKVDSTYGALDFHVLHGSLASDLATLRARLTVPSQNGDWRLWAGPIVVGDYPAPNDWLDQHHERRIRDAMDGLRVRSDRPPVVSRSGLHKLRQALLGGEAEVERIFRQVVIWAPGEGERARLRTMEYLKEHLLVSEGAPYLGVFSRVVSAIDLLDMEAGTASRRLSPETSQQLAGAVR